MQASGDSTDIRGGADLATARRLYAIALQNTSNEAAVKKGAIERELNEVIKQNAERYKQVAIGYDDPLNCTDDNSAVVFSGNIQLPELRAQGLNVSGRGRLALVGNQFKLISEGETYTGTFSTTTTGNYTAVALRFDSPTVGQNAVTVSLRGEGNCNRLRLQSSKRGVVTMAALSAAPIDEPR